MPRNGLGGSARNGLGGFSMARNGLGGSSMAKDGLGDGPGDSQKWSGRPEMVWEWPEMVSEAPKWRRDPRYGLGVNK